MGDSPSRAWLALIAALGLTAATCGGGSIPECEAEDDCEPGELCIDGDCIFFDDWTCSTNDGCPAGQYCCRNTCGPERCCVVHTDCKDGYCKDGRCEDGLIPSCPDIDCPVGVCNPTAGTCVECTRDSDCTEPLICGHDSTCVLMGQDCGEGVCGVQKPICAPQEGCRTCIENTGDCGNQVCVAGACVPCDGTAAPCHGGLACTVESGRCTMPLGVWCVDYADCGELACHEVAWSDHNECMACTVVGECGAQRECNAGTCEAYTPVCEFDADCNPPSTICEAGLCVPGCTRMSCYQGMGCNVATGRCYPAGSGDHFFGEICTSHGDCLSGACWAVDNDFQYDTFCSWPCVEQSDCPLDSVCWQLGDSSICIWIDYIFNEPLPDFDLGPGAACEAADFISLDCRSGFCHRLSQESTQAVCMEMCGRDADCEGMSVDDVVCVSGWPVGEDFDTSGVLEADELVGFVQLCHLGWGHLGNNMTCGSGADGSPLPKDHDACRSGWCVQTPDFTRDAHCAQPCCTPTDCGPNNPVCKPIDVWDGVREINEDVPYGFQKICLWREYAGTKEVGETCLADSECKTEICAAASSGTKRCTQTCCLNDDCAGFGWAPVCRKPYPVGTPLADSNYTAIRYSLGRQVDLGVASGAAIGVSSLCLPP